MVRAQGWEGASTQSKWGARSGVHRARTSPSGVRAGRGRAGHALQVGRAQGGAGARTSPSGARTGRGRCPLSPSGARAGRGRCRTEPKWGALA